MKYLKLFKDNFDADHTQIEDTDIKNLIDDIFVEFFDNFNSKEIKVKDWNSENNIFNIKFDYEDRIFYTINQDALLSFNSLHTVKYKKDKFYVQIKYIKTRSSWTYPGCEPKKPFISIENNILTSLEPIVKRLTNKLGYTCDIKNSDANHDEFDGESASFEEDLNDYYDVRLITIKITTK